jgi:hypothetical protein
MHHIEDHADEATVVVRGRASGVSPLTALHEHFLSGLENRDPMTGLSDDESYLAFYRMVTDTPSLLLRLGRQWITQGTSLAAVFAEEMGTDATDIAPTVAANQVIGTQQALVARNSERMFSGLSAAAAYPDAVADAARAFALLANGLSSCGLDAPS